MRDIFKTQCGYSLGRETNTPFGQLIIENLGTKPIRLDRDLAGNLLGIGRGLKKKKNIH